MSLTNEVRKFQDDDFREAVKLLSLMNNDVESSIDVLEMMSMRSQDTIDAMKLSRSVLDRLDGDLDAAKQLLKVTDQFREILGIKSAIDSKDLSGI